MPESEFSILRTTPGEILSEIYVHEAKEEIKELILSFGGLAKTARRFNIKYSRLKEWPAGRKPIPISTLREFIAKSSTGKKAKCSIDSKQIYISCRYSKYKMTSSPA